MVRTAALVTTALLVVLPAVAAELVPGAVLLTEEDLPRLLQLDPESGELSLVSGPGAGSGPALVEPRDVALGPDGLLYVADAVVGVFRIDPVSGDRQVLLPGRFDHARSVELDSQGFLYVLDSEDTLIAGFRASGIVYRVDLADDDVEVVVSTSGGTVTLEAPRDIALTAADQLLFADLGGRVRILQPPRTFTTLSERDVLLSALAMDPQGGLPFVVSNDPQAKGLYRAVVFSSLAVVSRDGFGAGPDFSSPASAAVGPDVAIYVTDRDLGLFRVDRDTGARALLLESNGMLLRGVAVLPETLAILDMDGDGVADLLDLCPDDFDPDQGDFDGNGVGDACNDFADPDGDEIADGLDNCPGAANPAQLDRDGDGLGDACNDSTDLDGDDFRDELDNCPEVANDQLDVDGDGLGDACDPFPLDFDNEKEQLQVDLAMCLERDGFDDADGDGEEDATDACPETPSGAGVDAAGCSQGQFCALQAGGDPIRWFFSCLTADWRNDESTAWITGDCQPSFASGIRCEASLP